MKKITLVSSAVVASMVVGLSGCGSSSTPSATTDTGTGYYVDSAVSGVTYKCGSLSGTTDKDGKFTFEKGKECSFEVAGVPLRNISADKLADGIKVVEDNVSVAKLLQSIDNDGNPDNGIQITDEVVKVLQEAIEEYKNPTVILADTSVLEEAVADIENNVTTFEGHVKTCEEVKGHLTKTQTEVTKELLAGKTFYVVENDDKKGWEKSEVHFNNDVTILTDDEGNADITITGNRMTFDDDTDGSYTIVTPMADYILFDDRNADGSKDGEGHFAFANEADAQAFLDSKTGGSANSSDLASLIVGKTLYQHCIDDGRDGVEEITFGSNDKLTIKELNGDIEENSYDINGSVITTYEYEDGYEEKEIHTLIESTDKYIKFDEGDGKTSTFYYNKDDALNASADDCGDGDGSESYVTHGKTTGIVTYHPNVSQIKKAEFDTANNTLKIYFNEAMTWGTNVETTGAYEPVVNGSDIGFSSDGLTYTFKFKTYKPGGLFNVSKGYFATKSDSSITTEGFSINFPK
jgi:hypothetical protein